jgi:Domain of unknown function (DUF4347)
MEDPQLGKDREGQLNRLGAKSLRLIMYGMSNGVAQVITEITRRAPIGAVNVLRIWSHGRAGGQTFTGGHGGEAYRVAHWTGISVANIDALAPTLSELAPYFSPHGRVELRGCEVASGAEGEQLLLRLAAIWQVPVLAGSATQFRAEWDGTVVEATPSGALMCMSATGINN